MGFWDEYEDDGPRGSFITEDDTKKIVKNKTVLEIIDVKYKPEDRFGEAYHVVVLLDGEERTKRFAADSGVDSRNRQLAAMAKYFEADGEPIKAQLEYAGQALLIRPAE